MAPIEEEEASRYVNPSGDIDHTMNSSNDKDVKSPSGMVDAFNAAAMSQATRSPNSNAASVIRSGETLESAR